MCTSSTSKISFLPSYLGPKILPDLLSILSSIVACKSELVVLDEKLTVSFIHFSDSRPLIKKLIMTDFAVPESPQNSTGLLIPLSLMFLCKMYLNLVVSSVGTKIFENFPSEGGT